jgi:hypothetical protein
LVNGVAAVCAVTLVAAVLVLFGRSSKAATTVSAHAAPARPAGTTSGTTAPGTVVTATATAAATTTNTAIATSTTPAPAAAPATAPPTPATTINPALDPNHRWAVGTQSFTFVDSSRSTPPADGDPGEASRTLPTVVLYPADGPVSAPETAGAAPSHLGRPFPLLVFAHGYDSSPAVYATLLRAWASAGYVVAAPSFPRATAGGPLDEDDVDNQPGDLSYVITRMLAMAGPGGQLAGVVDPAHVGVAGHSDGASTTAGIGYNSCCRDGRVAADAVMEGDLHDYPGGSWFPSARLAPLLVIQGDSDELNPPELGQAVYNGGRSPRYLLWLINAQHLEPYTTDTDHLAVVEAVTTAFFDRYLKGRVAAVSQMRRAATPGLATLSSA